MLRHMWQKGSAAPFSLRNWELLATINHLEYLNHESREGSESRSVQFTSVQSLSHVWLFATPWTAAHQASLSITNSQSYSNSCPLSQRCHPNISFSVIPFSSCLQSFPASGSFDMSQFFTLSGRSIGVSTSASILPVICFRLDSLDPFPLQGLSRVFSITTVRKHQSLVLNFLYSPTLTSIHDYWKNHSFD